MSNFNERSGDFLKTARIHHHLTQAALAEKLDISLSYENSLENGQAQPSLDLFCRMIRLLNLSADDYVYPERAMENPSRAELRQVINYCNDRQISCLLEAAKKLPESRCADPPADEH